MTDPLDSCGSDRERHIVPKRCGCQCVWPDCLNDSERKNLRLMLHGQLDARLARWAGEAEDAA